MKLLKAYNLKSSSLVETIISFLIISICFSLATLSYVNFTKSYTEVRRINITNHMDYILYRALKNKDFENGFENWNDYIFKKEFTLIEKSKNKIYFKLILTCESRELDDYSKEFYISSPLMHEK